MQIKDYILSILLFFIPILTAQCQQTNNYCQYFYEHLKEIPHEKLENKSGIITFSWDNKKYNGCEIEFLTNDTLLNESDTFPAFTRGPDPTLSEEGWRENINYTADGPGSGVYGIEKDKTLCLIYYGQPAYFDNGEKVQISEITITVECVDRNRE